MDCALKRLVSWARRFVVPGAPRVIVWPNEDGPHCATLSFWEWAAAVVPLIPRSIVQRVVPKPSVTLISSLPTRTWNGSTGKPSGETTLIVPSLTPTAEARNVSRTILPIGPELPLVGVIVPSVLICASIRPAVPCQNEVVGSVTSKAIPRRLVGCAGLGWGPRTVIAGTALAMLVAL